MTIDTISVSRHWQAVDDRSAAAVAAAHDAACEFIDPTGDAECGADGLLFSVWGTTGRHREFGLVCADHLVPTLSAPVDDAGGVYRVRVVAEPA